jgi:phosphoserine phosphatase RsbU/P
MKVLLAEDDPVSRRMLEVLLGKWGHEVVLAGNGAEALQILQGHDAPRLAILDWMMPHVDGVEVCRQLRKNHSHEPTYVILLTAKTRKEEIVEGLGAGADDYVTKPFDSRELQARVNVGRRIIELQSSLAQRVRELEEALAHVKQLRGLLPICAWCHKIRDDQNYWQSVETYISGHSDARFSHGICPDCFQNVVNSAGEKRDGQTSMVAPS